MEKKIPDKTSTELQEEFKELNKKAEKDKEKFRIPMPAFLGMPKGPLD